MTRHPKGTKARVLLSSVFGPYAQDDEFGSRKINPMELYHNQVTREQGPFSLRMFHRSWGIGRHVEGSQIFDYWRDPDGLLVEHFTDGDRFDCTLEPGWSPMTASGLAQWGPPASKDFMGISPGRETVRELASMVTALREDNEFDLSRLRGMLKMATS